MFDLLKPTHLVKRFTQKLSKTRLALTDGLAHLLLGKKTIDENLLEALETLLITADLGIKTTQYIIEALTRDLKRQALKDPKALEAALKTLLIEILKPCVVPLDLKEQPSPFVILVVGVNGSGKTTTIAKLAQKFQADGKKILLAAGDTFRAAAIEQLTTWGTRHQIPVIAQHTGADSASVIFDSFKAAQARQTDLLIADTAGRLHTQDHLMAELQKIKKVLSKLDPQAPHETLLVLDASIGQNALVQAQLFHEALNVTGIAMTKLDGTAKGGILFSIAQQLKLPIRFIGIGEQADDLVRFEAEPFVEALFSKTATHIE